MNSAWAVLPEGQNHESENIELNADKGGFTQIKPLKPLICLSGFIRIYPKLSAFAKMMCP
jgi:hypothetical protein